VSRAFACLLLLVVGGVTPAQDLPPLPVPPPQPLAPAPAPTPDPNAGKYLYGTQPLFEPIVMTEPEPVWRTDLLLGGPTALRVQRQLPGRRLWVEGGAGWVWFWPTVFAGVRGEGTLFDGASDVFSVRPGLDAYYLQGWGNDRRGGYNLFSDMPSGLMVTLDFDLSWRHRFSRFVHGEVAMKVGLGPVIANGRVIPLPVGALSVGLNY
jgi:hypothetical protein